MDEEELASTRPNDAQRTTHGIQAPAEVELRSSTVIGRYVIVRPLGRGGMGAVMLAIDTQLGGARP